MTCPHCHRPMPEPRGRPKHLDDREVMKLRAKGLSLREIARQLGVSLGAVQGALRRS